jgi:hypothetical protein
MGRRSAPLLAALAAALLLLGLGRPSAAAGPTAGFTVADAGHAPVVLALVHGPRVPAADTGGRLPALAGSPPAVPVPAAARTTTDGTTRTPAPHLAASTGDRAPPALP